MALAAAVQRVLLELSEIGAKGFTIATARRASTGVVGNESTRSTCTAGGHLGAEAQALDLTSRCRRGISTSQPSNAFVQEVVEAREYQKRKRGYP